MPIKSPGYKSYKIEGSNLSIPGWLIQHRGESVDRAVTAATNALVPADVQRNLVFRDDEKNINPVINRDKSFKLLAIVPTEVPEVGDNNSTVLDNQFKFTLLDERFIDKQEAYSEDDIRKLLRYQAKQTEGDSALSLEKIITDYKEANPTLTTLWGSIKAARDVLRNDPYIIYNDEDNDAKYKVLLTDPNKSALPEYGKVTAAHLDNNFNFNETTEDWVVDLRIDANDSSLFEE